MPLLAILAQVGASPVSAAEIQVEGNAIVIADGDATPSELDHTDFGDVDIDNGTVDRVFTIRNVGGTVLNITGTPNVAISGDHAADFTVTVQPADSIGPGLTSTFTIEFDPSAVGERTATVTIESDDADEDPYTFSILGNGTTRELDITEGGEARACGSELAAQTTVHGGLSPSWVLLLTNSGNDDLTITSIEVTAPFVLVEPTTFPITIEPAASVTVIVELDASEDPGTYGGTITINNDDTDEGACVLTIADSEITEPPPPGPGHQLNRRHRFHLRRINRKAIG